MMDKLISQQAAIDKIKKRLFETAFNNVGIKQNIDETLADVAENRLENWFGELPTVQPDTTTHDSIPAETGKNGEDRTTDDLISRQQTIDALIEQIEQCNKALGSFDISLKDEYAIKVERASLEAYKEQLENLPSAQPKTAKRIVGKSRDGMTLWYQCDTCNEPVDEHDNFCRGCGRRLIDEAD